MQVRMLGDVLQWADHGTRAGLLGRYVCVGDLGAEGRERRDIRCGVPEAR